MYLVLFPNMTVFQAKFEDCGCVSGVLLQQSVQKYNSTLSDEPVSQRY